MEKYIISGMVMSLCATVMIIIGVSQFKSKKPVGFYTGEKAPKENEISDVNAWNKKHGTMWILYGVIILLAFVISLFMHDLLVIIPYFICLLLPLPLMINYHNRLISKYYLKK